MENRAVSDEEDIVLSVFDSFYNAAENGRFPDLSDRDDLWQLLLRMSATKVVDKRRHDQRQRRGGNVKVRSLNQTDDDDSVIEAIGDEPSPEMVLMMRQTDHPLLRSSKNASDDLVILFLTCDSRWRGNQSSEVRSGSIPAPKRSFD